MSLKRFTDLQIQRLKPPPKGQRTLFESTGLGIRLSQGGAKSFIVQLGSQRKKVTLGRYPALSLKNARTKAVRLLSGDILNVTAKPSEAISDFLEHSERHNKPRTTKDYKRLLDRHFPSSFKRQAILAKLNGLTQTPAEQSHATTAFQIFLNWCVSNGILEQNPIAGLKNQGRIKKRDRTLSLDELRAVWHALPNDRFGIIVRLLILTGQRKGEIPHITIDEHTATIPSERTKNGHRHEFPVGPITKKLFQPVNYAGWGKAKARLDKDCGVSNWTLHDLRRTYATIHAQLGTPIHVIEKLLNHISGGSMTDVARIYNRHSYWDEQCDAVQRYEDWLSSQVLRHVKT